MAEDRRFPAPWTVEAQKESWCVKDAAGFALTWFHWREEYSVGTYTERMTREQARKMAVAFARIPDQPRFTADDRKALKAFIDGRADDLTEGEAVLLLVRDALVGLGAMPLGVADRGPGARRGC